MKSHKSYYLVELIIMRPYPNLPNHIPGLDPINFVFKKVTPKATKCLFILTPNRYVPFQSVQN